MDVVILRVCCRSWIENTRLYVPQWAKPLVLPVRVLVGRSFDCSMGLDPCCLLYWTERCSLSRLMLVSLITIYRGTSFGQVIFVVNVFVGYLGYKR